jgi:hypothetical protein
MHWSRSKRELVANFVGTVSLHAQKFALLAQPTSLVIVILAYHQRFDLNSRPCLHFQPIARDETSLQLSQHSCRECNIPVS